MRDKTVTAASTRMEAATRLARKSIFIPSLCLLLACCSLEPDSVIEYKFDNPEVTFFVETFEAGAGVANSHEVILIDRTSNVSERISIFYGIGGTVPKIVKVADKNFEIQYSQSQRYELVTVVYTAPTDRSPQPTAIRFTVTQ